MLGCFTWDVRAALLPLWASAGLPLAIDTAGTEHSRVSCDAKAQEQGQSPTIKHNKSPGLVVEVRRSPGPGLVEQGWRNRVSALAAEEAKLLGVAILPRRGKSRGRNLQGAMPPEQHLRESGAGSAPPDTSKHGHRNGKACSQNAGQRVSGPGRGLLGVAGLLLWAGWLYSLHFNTEIIKRGRGGRERKTQNICFTSNQGRFLCLQGMCKSRRAGRCT